MSEFFIDSAAEGLEPVQFTDGRWGCSSESLMRVLLRNEGIKDDEVLENTPRRWVKALRAQLGKEHEDFEFTTFPSEIDDMVIVSPIQFSSLCAHHLLPFTGVAHVGYVPNGRIVGLSKIPRLVKAWCFGLWTQEELTETIAKDLESKLSDPTRARSRTPKGVAVVMKAEHTCMTTRGTRALGAETTTSAMLGVFSDHTRLARSEFLGLIK